MGIKQIKKEKEKLKQNILNRIPVGVNIVQYYIDNFPWILLYKHPASSPISPSNLLYVSYFTESNIDDFFEGFLSELYKPPFPPILKKKIEIKLEALKLSVLDGSFYPLIKNEVYNERIRRFEGDFTDPSKKEDPNLKEKYNNFLKSEILLEIKNNLIILSNSIIPELINYIKYIVEEF